MDIYNQASSILRNNVRLVLFLSILSGVTLFALFTFFELSSKSVNYSGISLVTSIREHPELNVAVSQPPKDLKVNWEQVQQGLYKEKTLDEVHQGVNRRRYFATYKLPLMYEMYEVETQDALSWVIDNRLKPRILAAKMINATDTSNADKQEFYENILFLEESFLSENKYLSSTEAADELAWLRSLLEELDTPSLDRGWQEIHEGVWQRTSYSEIEKQGESVAYQTEDKDALKWLLINKLKPEAEQARPIIENANSRQDVSKKYLLAVDQYNMLLDLYEEQYGEFELEHINVSKNSSN